jgi:hypothetical protein
MNVTLPNDFQGFASALIAGNPSFVGKSDDSCEATAYQKEDGAVEWIRTTTVLLPPAPQAGASASSATTALR